MIPTYAAGDVQQNSKELASAIHAASSPNEIAAVCSAVDSFLRHHSADQSRWFFSLAFPTFICRAFGFEDSPSSTSLPKPSASGGWIGLASTSCEANLRGRVFDLFSPNGALMSSVSAVDRLSLVKYVFPTERLPEWVRVLLSSDRDGYLLPDLCPLFKGRVKEDSNSGSPYQVQLNVFEYYMFWFAYYPVYRGNSDSFDAGLSRRGRKFKLESWASPFPGFASNSRLPKLDQKVKSNLYIRLLYSYLRHYVPLCDLSAHQPYRSSLLHYPSGYDGLVALRAEFFVNTLIHSWLVHNDFSPLSTHVFKSSGASFPLRMLFGETPPTPGLAEVVKWFVKYMNMSLIPVTEASHASEVSGSPRWRISNSNDVSMSRDAASTSPYAHSCNSWIQRPLYRFILRSFLFYPVGSSMKVASEVFSLWICYMEPWEVGADDSGELDEVLDKSVKDSKFDSKSSSGYSSSWEGCVLSNYLFYSSLVMHFIGFAHKFLHTDPEVIVQMVSKVMSILTSSSEFVELLKSVDTVFHSKPAKSCKIMLNNLHRFVPSIREQLQDWEYGLCESNADGSFLHENWNNDLRLFGEDEHGGQLLLQLFILRAEAELQAMSRDNPSSNLQCLDHLKTQLSYLYGGLTMKPVPIAVEEILDPRSREDIFKPRKGEQRMLDTGDSMMRPVTDDEISWLAKLLIWVSAQLNESLGLSEVGDDGRGWSWRYVEISGGGADNVCGAADMVKEVAYSIGSWVMMVGVGVVWLIRRYGVRVNLRVLASKRIVMLMMVVAIAAWMRRVFGWSQIG